MRQFTQDDDSGDIVKTTVKNPPWGTEPETPASGRS